MYSAALNDNIVYFMMGLVQGRNYHWIRVDKVQGAPECRGPPSPILFFSKSSTLLTTS